MTPQVGPTWKCPDCGVWIGSFLGWADLQGKMLEHEKVCNVRLASEKERPTT